MLSRRKFVGRGVAVGAACWVAPTIVSVPVAWATDIGSRPPNVRQVAPKVEAAPQMGAPLATDLPADLPWTGQEQRREVEVGVAALTAGGVLWALNRPAKRAMP